MEDFQGFKNISIPWTQKDDNNLKKMYNIDKLNIHEISEIINKPECYIISKLIKLDIIEYRDDCRGYQKYKMSDAYNDNIDSERLFYIKQNKYIPKNKLLDKDAIIKEENLIDRLRRLKNFVKELRQIINNENDYIHNENDYIYNENDYIYNKNDYIYNKDSFYKYSGPCNIYLEQIQKTDKVILKTKKLKKILGNRKKF